MNRRDLTLGVIILYLMFNIFLLCDNIFTKHSSNPIIGDMRGAFDYLSE